MANAVRETLRMGDVLEKMCRSLRQTLGAGDPYLFRQIREGNNVIKDFDGAIKAYLTKLGRESLDEQDEKRCTEILNFTTALDHISNIVVMNMLELVETAHKNQVAISDEDVRDEFKLLDMMLENLRMSFSVLMTGNAVTAGNLIQRKQTFREVERNAVNEHLRRLRTNQMLDQEASAIHLSLLSDMRRINSLLTSNAYPVAGRKEE